jgi:hypothetical protein
MAKFSMKKQGKEVGPASTYAAPHTMEGGKTNIDTYSKYTPGAKILDESNPSLGGISKGNYKETKTTGIKIRGTGAATKGTMARGPMG